MKLSKRLQAIFDMVPPGIAADVGSDHGKLIISLFESGRISHGYAIENKTGPYNRLVKALKDKNLLNDIEPLFSDGVTDLPSNVNIVIIAGMGGDTIIDILRKNPAKIKNVQTLIVDGHTSVPKIREEITKMGFIIADENIIEEDGIFYEIIKFNRGDIAFYGDKDFEFGPLLRNQKSLVFKDKYEARIKEIDYIINMHNLPQERIAELVNEKERIRGIL